MTNIVGFEDGSDFGVAYLNQYTAYDGTHGYTWLDSSHHSFSSNLNIYASVDYAIQALKDWATL